MSAPESVIELLAKLMRHEQSARDIGSLAEAEAFASKVQQLLTAHKLDMSEIQFEEREQFEPVGQEIVSAHDLGIKRRPKRVRWQERLASAIAECNGCTLLITDHANTVFFVGRTSDRQVCVHIYGRFVRMAFELSEKSAGENRDEQRDKCKEDNGAVFAHWMRAYKNSFCVGFSNAMQTRFYEQRRQMEEAKKEADGEGCSAMVHMRKDAEAIKVYLDDLFKGRKESKAKPNFDSDSFNRDGYHSGQKAGNTVALASHELAERTA